METVQANPSVVSTPVFSKKCEPYTISADGHFVGSDGYVVPKNFAEFYAWEPDGVRRFVQKKLHRSTADEEVLDIEQDLLLHLHYLPEKSKYRKQGKTDIVQCFDPKKQHGASAKRFHNYLALCMSNRFYGILHKQKKNPVYNKTNLSLSGTIDPDNTNLALGEATDEFLHNNCTVFAPQARHHSDGNSNVKKIFVNQFKAYVRLYAPEMVSVIETIADTNNLKDARLALGVTGRAFDKQRIALDLLRDCFLRGENFHACKSFAVNRRNARLRAARDAKRAKKIRKNAVAI